MAFDGGQVRDHCSLLYHKNPNKQLLKNTTYFCI